MKRSPQITLVMLASVSALAVSGCEDVPNTPPDPGGTFANKAECVAVYDEQTCDAAEKLALQEHSKNAPKSTREQCIEEYGADMCRPADDGSGLFMPMMVGYMLGSMSNTPAPLYYAPYSYRSNGRSASLYSSGTGYGRTLVGTAPYRAATYTTPSTKASLKSSTAMTPPSTVARGGFGSSFKPTTSFKSTYTSANPSAFKASTSTYSSKSGVSRGGFGSTSRGFSGGG